MSPMDRFAQLANQLQAEEPEVPAVPFHARNGYHFQYGGYVCRDNGIGCGKAFATLEAKNQHRSWCRFHRVGD